jgi:hypothetical protein
MAGYVKTGRRTDPRTPAVSRLLLVVLVAAAAGGLSSAATPAPVSRERSAGRGWDHGARGRVTVSTFEPEPFGWPGTGINIRVTRCRFEASRP